MEGTSDAKVTYCQRHEHELEVTVSKIWKSLQLHFCKLNT